MDLGRDVLDKQLLDSQMHRCGKVDDLVLEVEGDDIPEVSAILSQQGTLARDIGPFAMRVARCLYRLMGVPDPNPVAIDWDLVDKIDVVVHLSQTRHALGLDRIQHALSRRIVGRIPGA